MKSDFTYADTEKKRIAVKVTDFGIQACGDPHPIQPYRQTFFF